MLRKTKDVKQCVFIISIQLLTIYAWLKQLYNYPKNDCKL